MPLFEVWEYGCGDGPRNTYQTVSEKHAIKAYLDRTLITGDTYRNYLKEQGQERLLICVKDPAHKGTRQDPNYPSVYTLTFSPDDLQATFDGYLTEDGLMAST